MKDKIYALISVYDKTGILDLAKAFVKHGITIIASGGTAAHLQKYTIPYIPIEQITTNPESFDGRMKTISFQIASGILFDRTRTKHIQEAKKLHIPSIDFVVCNFYAFWEHPSIEMIDVGGPTMIRAAAKNYQSVTTLVEPNDYAQVIQSLEEKNETTGVLRKDLAAKAFSYVANYDGMISNFFQKETDGIDKTYTLQHGVGLRYGENPHQKGIFYPENTQDPLGLGKFRKLQGKETSYSNYLDVDSGIQAMSRIGTKNPACIILKHTNPCGAAIAETIDDAFKKAWFDGDPLAAFGGIIIMNRPVDATLAKTMLADKKFFEILAAPAFTNEALAIFSQKPKLQLLENTALAHPTLFAYEEVKKIRGGFLTQDGDTNKLAIKQLMYVTKKKPTQKQLDEVFFAWGICQVSKSNCVVVVKDGVMLASGVGQQDRKRCCELCVRKASGSLRDAVAATDGFFPFRDGPDVLIQAGISAIIQPGGSIRDQETIDACNEAGVAMVLTGTRIFKH